VIQTKVTNDNVATFTWPCGCSVSFQGKHRPVLAPFLSDDFDVWDAKERRKWRWIAETACNASNGAHGGFEIRRFRLDEARAGNIPIRRGPMVVPGSPPSVIQAVLKRQLREALADIALVPEMAG
jgi:hypothetical protein